MITLHIVKENFGKGDPHDDSESWTTKTTAFVTRNDKEEEEFAEWLTGKYEDQDYSYTVNHTRTHYDDDVYEALKKCMLHQEKEDTQ